MKISYKPFELNLRHPFTIAKFSRTSTPIMLMEISHEGYTGFGEASMVPYMGENIESAMAFMAKVNLSWLKAPFDFDELITYLDSIAPGNPNIKAAVDGNSDGDFLDPQDTTLTASYADPAPTLTDPVNAPPAGLVLGGVATAEGAAIVGPTGAFP